MSCCRDWRHQTNKTQLRQLYNNNKEQRKQKGSSFYYFVSPSKSTTQSAKIARPPHPFPIDWPSLFYDANQSPFATGPSHQFRVESTTCPRRLAPHCLLKCVIPASQQRSNLYGQYLKSFHSCVTQRNRTRHSPGGLEVLGSRE